MATAWFLLTCVAVLGILAGLALHDRKTQHVIIYTYEEWVTRNGLPAPEQYRYDLARSRGSDHAQALSYVQSWTRIANNARYGKG